MEVAGRCDSCGEERMVMDSIYGVLACDACGRVGNQTETELRSEWQMGHVIERHGTFVGETDSGVGAAKGLIRGQVSRAFYTDSPLSRERSRIETMKKVESITAMLRVPGDKLDEVKKLLESTLEGDWGTGRWTDVLVAACVYIVIRQCQLPLTIPEVADCVNCDVVELGRMYNRVLLKLGVNLPNVDSFVFLERAASSLPALTKLNKDMVRKMKKQGTLLLEWAHEWFITTGRRPLPVVAAVLSLVVEANKVVIEISEVARELRAGLWATKKRYKECQSALIGIGQSLPWGKDITLKTVPRHLPFLLQYLDMKTKLAKKKKGPELSGSSSSHGASEPLGANSSNQLLVLDVPERSVAAYNSGLIDLGEKQSQTASATEQPPLSLKRYLGVVLPDENVCDTSEPPSILSEDDQESIEAPGNSGAQAFHEGPVKRLKITAASCSATKGQLGSDDKDDETFSERNISAVSHNQQGGVDYECKELALVPKDDTSVPTSLAASEQKQLEWQGLPAAFCASVDARERRRVKIDLAKNRIFEARKALSDRFGTKLCSCDSLAPVKSGQGRLDLDVELSNKLKTGLDWEDLVIEHLVLCGASEVELENGYYRALLAHYPEQTDSDFMDNNMASFFRTRSEINLVLELASHLGEGVMPHYPSPLASLPPSST